MSRSFGLQGQSEDSIRAPLQVWEYLTADLPQTPLIVLFVLKNASLLLINTTTASFRSLRENVQGARASKPIAFTLEHPSWAASPGAWSKPTEGNEGFPGVFKSFQSPTLAWFGMKGPNRAQDAYIHLRTCNAAYMLWKHKVTKLNQHYSC